MTDIPVRHWRAYPSPFSNLVFHIISPLHQAFGWETTWCYLFWRRLGMCEEIVSEPILGTLHCCFLKFCNSAHVDSDEVLWPVTSWFRPWESQCMSLILSTFKILSYTVCPNDVFLCTSWLKWADSQRHGRRFLLLFCKPTIAVLKTNSDSWGFLY